MYIGYARISSKIILQITDTTQWGGTKLNYGTFGFKKKEGDNNVILCTKATYPIVLYDYALHSMQSIKAAYLHKSLLLGLVLLPAFKCNSRKTFICVLTRHGNKTQLRATKHISAS